MRTGKISENVLKRSVLKRCTSKNDNMAQGPGIGQDCAIVRIEGQKEALLSTQAATGMEKGIWRMAVYSCANNLYSSGGRPLALTTAVVLPAAAKEEELRYIIDELNSACSELKIALCSGHTEVSEHVKDAVVTVTCFGVTETKALPTSEIVPDLDLVMTGRAGLCGTALLARRHAEELKERFPISLVEDACRFDQELSVKKAAELAKYHGAAAMHDVSEGGIFGALWEMCESAKVGMEVDLRKIPIRQESIEICEIYGLNPYQMLSGGSLLIAVKDGKRLVDFLSDAGVEASVIGWTTDKKDKILKNGEETRYLDKPAQDQIRMDREWQN